MVLLKHCAIYSLPFLYFGVWYSFLAGLLHFIVDWNTSRATSYLWEKQEVHWFFVVIGFDQAVHMTLLICTYIILF